MSLEMEKEIIITQSQKNETSLERYKNKLFKVGLWIALFLGGFYIVGLVLGFALGGVSSDEVVSFLGFSTLAVVLSVGMIAGFIYLMYWSTKTIYDNVHWTITNKGLTLINYKVKTFIPTNHISSVTISKETLQVITIDKYQPITLSFLKNADELKKALDDLIYKTEKQKEVVVLENTDSMSEIKKYKDLLDSGIITQEEFDTKKKQLLGL